MVLIKVAYNVQGFLLCWYSVIRQPEPKLSKVNPDDVIFYGSPLFIQPGLQMISERDDQYIFYIQHCRKPYVGWSLYLIRLLQRSQADLLLSLDTVSVLEIEFIPSKKKR